MDVIVENRGNATVAWAKGAKHKLYEDRYRLLPASLPLVQRQNRGEIFAVFDGIGGAPMGMSAAQTMADHLVDFFRQTDSFPPTWQAMEGLLQQANHDINGWGMLEGTDRPLGGCAGTIAWIHEQTLTTFHAGDTVGLLIKNGHPTQLTRIHGQGKILYNYFGRGNALTIDIDRCTVEEGDWILLISDGVTKVFHPLEAAGFVSGYKDGAMAARDLAYASQAKGSPDDITVVLVEVEDCDE